MFYVTPFLNEVLAWVSIQYMRVKKRMQGSAGILFQIIFDLVSSSEKMKGDSGDNLKFKEVV